jgi:DNA-directed RNA polymerase beta subunit
MAAAGTSMDTTEPPTEDPTLAAFGATSVRELGAPIPRLEDKWKLIPAFLRVRGLVMQHVRSFDHFIERELKQILAANSEIRSDVRVGAGARCAYGTAHAGCVVVH